MFVVFRSASSAAPRSVDSDVSAPDSGSAHDQIAQDELDARVASLTFREREVLELVQLGITNAEIADHLFISDGTVRKHLENAFQKLGVHTRTQATRMLDAGKLLPPVPAPADRPKDMPRYLTTFVGRERELGDLRQLLSTTRLLTLTGPGGVGKTRLALQLIDGAAEGDRGARFVDLGGVADPSLVEGAVASSVGVREQPGYGLREALIQYLRSRRLILLLDNCEHVLAACARLGDDLLRACSGLQVLATSRQPLGIDGETIYTVPSLSVPAPDERPAVDRVLACEAVQLFAQRAASAQPAFSVTASTAPLVGRICRRLDGIPLAIELTAALVRTRPLELIEDGLSDRFRLLVSSSAISVPRHQTLHATVAWSHDLLDEPERALLRRLSVFAGSFESAAAEAVCGDDDGHREVVDTLARLVDKSLVVLDSDGRSGRYRLLETVREFGRDRLVESGEAPLIRARHGEWYLTLVEHARVHLFGGPQQADWLARLDDEHDNIRAALEWSQADDWAPDASLRLVVGMWHFWEIRGHLAEGRRWLEGALSASRGMVSDRRAHALTGAGILAYMQGDYAGAFALHEESLDLHRRLGEPASIAYALSNLGNVATELGAYARARACHEEVANMQRMLGNDAEVATASIHLAEILERQGDTAGASTLFETTLVKLDDLAEHSATPGELGFIRWLLGYGLSMYAAAALRSGDHSRARQLALRALFVYRDAGDAREGARVLAQLADVTSAQGDARAATALLLEALVTRHHGGDRPGIASTLERLADITAPIDPERAGRQLGAADALRAEMGTPVPARDSGRLDQLRAALLTGLGPRRFEAMLDEGRGQTLAEVVADASALATDDARPPRPLP